MSKLGAYLVVAAIACGACTKPNPDLCCSSAADCEAQGIPADQLCTGGLICSAQVAERLRHFVSRNAFDIEGLGDKHIAEFHKDGLLKNPADIFRLKDKREALEEREGWGKQSVAKLFAAMDSSTQEVPLSFAQIVCLFLKEEQVHLQ